jgi:hypothetical protein
MTALTKAQERALEWLPGVQARFMASCVPEPNSGCWLWGRSGTEVGYGHIFVAGRKRYAHRLSFEMFHGPIPEGACVCHRCDVPACVNPDHLFLGSIAENNRDMLEKGRRASFVGEMNGAAKVSRDEVLAIRAAAGSVSSISRRFGYSRCTVREIRGGKRWAHIQPAGLALRASRQPHQTPPEPAEPLGGTGQPSDASGASCGAVRAGMEGGR